MKQEVLKPGSMTPEERKLQKQVDRAEAVHNNLVQKIHLWQKNKLEAWGLLCIVREEELWRHRGASSFAEYVCQLPGGITPKTANTYADAFDLLVVKHKIAVDKFEGISTDKLLMLRKVKQPEKFLDDARERGPADFDTLIRSEITGIPEQKIADAKEARRQSAVVTLTVCPHWDPGSCTCKAGVRIIPPGSRLKKGKKAKKDAGSGTDNLI